MKNIFGPHTQPCKTTRYTMKSMLCTMKSMIGGGGKRAEGFYKVEYENQNMFFIALLARMPVFVTIAQFEQKITCKNW